MPVHDGIVKLLTGTRMYFKILLIIIIEKIIYILLYL